MGGFYVADAHAFARYLSDELPKGADAIFESAERQECKICVPSIAIAELIYVFERTKTEPKIGEMFNKIDLYPSFPIHPLDEKILRIIPNVKLKDLHDRIIVGTSIAIRADGLITKDQDIKRTGLVKTIW